MTLLKFAQKLVTYDEFSHCRFCEKSDWGAEKHNEYCPFAVAYAIIRSTEEKEHDFELMLEDIQCRLGEVYEKYAHLDKVLSDLTYYQHVGIREMILQELWITVRKVLCDLDNQRRLNNE